MINVIMHGCCGKMGHVVAEIAAADERMQICAGVDVYNDGTCAFPVYEKLTDVKEKADVIIDFSSAKAVDALLDYCESTGTPVVLCSTGLSAEQLERVKKVSEKTAVLKSANMSLGINLLMKVLGEIAPLLADAGYDVEIVEKHHNLKLDAPSGTAIALADSVNEACENRFEYIYDRSQRRQKRDKKELGISAVRGGTIVGDHDVIFAGLDEVITLSHRAYSKSVFAKGAVSAAAFLAGKGPGLYDMSDVIEL
jgi:4-hydroxy-tetrahydrodipicolinate reductase